GERRPERRIGLTRGEAARHPRAKNGTARHFHNSDFSKLERPFARRPWICAVAPLGPAPAPAVAPPEPPAESVPLVAATGAPGLPELKKIHTVAIRSDLPDSVGDALATPMVSPLAPAPVPAPGSPEPKKIHTVTIRSDGSG